ncbi:hypothetical protein [Sediminibacillus halophilus]|uniref:hypothetical protein n=1 Tax=Sediminibacillus halophilus TaxID=482461 RepID=UPI0015872D4D|nr:hypothetical protein [Sediminibacillus halophilus]
MDRGSDFYDHYWLAEMREKLKLYNQEEQDEVLIQDLPYIMEEHDTDFINTFRALK